MKVLLISDNSNDIQTIDAFMKNEGYDVIVYQWLIKAIDNIAEIKPDIVIINAKEYPRRWKTLAAFLKSGIGGNNIKLYLYEPEPLSEDENKKARVLEIKGSFSSLDNKSLEECFPNLIDFYYSKESDKFIPKPLTNSRFIFTNPNSGRLLSGKLLNFSNNILECKMSSTDLKNGQLLKYVSIYYNDEISFLSAKVKDFDEENEKLLLSVCEYYEEI